ncbi:unnamed protein product [Pylaiella littoralis]
MASTAAGQQVVPPRKKARRGSRHGETVSPSHYGPVACTSAAAALVQAYLTVGTFPGASTATVTQQQQSNGVSISAKGGNSSSANGSSNSKSGSSSTNSISRSALRATGDSISSFLYMSESTFDPVKRRFGGKSKPVTLANSTANGTAAAGTGSSSSSSSSKGARLSFGHGTKIVASKEAMHATLHCRCVFVLLCELASSCDGGTGGKASSSSANPAATSASAAAAAAAALNKRNADTAHLITLSPDDLFCALSVDSFPLLVPTRAEAATVGGGGSSGPRGQKHQHRAPPAAGALPRAFEVVDGPAVIHRPAARVGEPWRGLEIFRPEPAAGPWRGHRVPLPAPGRTVEESDESDAGSQPSSTFGGGPGGGRVGNRGGAAFRLDLSAASAVDGGGASVTATPPPPLSQEPGSGSRSKKRTAGVGSNPLVVCLPMAPFSAPGSDFTTDHSGCWGGSRPRGMSRRCDGIEAAVVALPPSGAAAACAVAEQGGDEGDPTPPPPPPCPPPQWTSLSVDREGRASLSPWRGLPPELKSHPTCLCRAPAVDSGAVSLAAGALTEVAAAGLGGLVLRSLPPTIYVGVAADGSRSGLDSSGRGSAGAGGGGGALLELQGGTLCCSRLLPAPPSAVVTAAVDDAQGVLAVLLADQARTALLLARDGSDLPVVEQHRGIAAAFAGDFLGNGREQVALLCSASAAGGSAGGGRAGKQGAASAAAAMKAGVGGWEQLPLKALVKRAVVTDCSFDWENERRHDSPAAPPGSGGGGGGVSGKQGGAEASRALPEKAASGTTREALKGKKRARSMEVADDGGAGGSGPPVADEARRLSKSESNRGPDDDCCSSGPGRLSNIVQVVRRRVRAEETRLLRLRQARGGKATVLRAARLALAAHVGNGVVGGVFDADGQEDASGGNGRGSRCGAADWSAAGSVARNLVDGLVAPGGGNSSIPSPGWIDERASEASPRPPPQSPTPLKCTVAGVRFHAPSRTLCLDAHISNPTPRNAGDAAAGSSTVAAGVPARVVRNVCLTVASPSSSCLTTRSALCARLRPGESATVRACVDIPLGLLASGGGGPASLFVSCAWSLPDDDVAAAAAAGLGTTTRDSDNDVLGMGGALSSTALAPGTKMRQGPRYRSSTNPASGAAAGGLKKNGAVSASHNSGSSTVDSKNHHLGLFDVGTRLDVLLQSDPTTSTSANLAELPQAVRSLSDVAALPEPWAGGAAVQVHSCSERAAACTLRANDSVSSPAVLLAVAAGALPDGARGSTDHASERGRALVAAAAAALRDEVAALEAVARERGRMDGGAARSKKGSGGGGGGGGSGGAETTGGLAVALESYGASQMKSDLLAAKLAGRVVAAARGGAPLGDWSL